MTSQVRPATRADEAWVNLAAELTPAKSLARVDAATARTVTTVTIIGVLLTGLGILSAGQLSQNGPAQGLATAAVITAALAVASALIAQVLTVTRQVNPANLIEVKAWYRRQFNSRAYPTQAATVLLLLAALLAGAAATARLLTHPAAPPAIDITQDLAPASTVTPASVHATVTVRVTFPGLAPSQLASVTVTTSGTNRLLGSAAATPGPDGTAVTTLTVSNLTPSQTLFITAAAGDQRCQTELNASTSPPALACHTDPTPEVRALRVDRQGATEVLGAQKAAASHRLAILEMTSTR